MLFEWAIPLGRRFASAPGAPAASREQVRIFLGTRTIYTVASNSFGRLKWYTTS